MRDVKVGCAAAKFDGGFQDDHRHRAVNVIVAVDEDWFLAFDGRIQAVDGRAQSRHLLRRVKMRQARREKTLRGVRIGNAPACQQWSEHARCFGSRRAAECRVRAQTCCQAIDQRRVGWLLDPLHG